MQPRGAQIIDRGTLLFAADRIFSLARRLNMHKMTQPRISLLHRCRFVPSGCFRLKREVEETFVEINRPFLYFYL